MYGARKWAVKKAQDKKLDVTEMRLLRWICGVTKMDKIKMRQSEGQHKLERSQRKYTKEGYSVTATYNEKRRCVCGKTNAGVASGRGQGKRKTDLDMGGQDQRQKGLTSEDAQDRARWKRLARHIDPT